MCFVGKARNGNVVEVVDIVLLGNVVPFDMRELSVVTHIRVGDAAVQQDACDVGVVCQIGRRGNPTKFRVVLVVACW